ncbi:hypothetical protein [Marinobacter salarius]|uniref:hypothetical protein n=1 Tax=Marinobacter salarius TaxID=1420917 RepID=UPI0032ECA3DF
MALVENGSERSEAGRRNVVSSLRRFCEVLDFDPKTAPADFEHYRDRLQKFHPLMAGLKPKRWADIRSDVSFALRTYAVVRPPRRPFSPQWAAVKDAGKNLYTLWRLQRFCRYCDDTGIDPIHVGEQVFLDFREFLKTSTFKAKPDRKHRDACSEWNKLASACPHLGLPTVPLPSYRETYSPAWDELPASFRQEADDWLTMMSEEADILDLNAPTKPWRPATIDAYRYALRQCAGALLAKGWNIQEISSLSVLVTVDTTRTIHEFFLERSGNKPTSTTAKVANVLVLVAKTAVKVNDPETVEALKTFRKRLSVRKRGMRARPKAALQQFTDPANIEAILILPLRIYGRLKNKKALTLEDARLMRVAVMLELLLMRPIRRKNLGSLRFGKHVFRTGRRVSISIPADEVKNDEELDYKIPPESAELLNFYEKRLLPLFGANPERFLFPGNILGQALAPEHLSQIFRKTIRAETGLDFYMHFARHFGANLYLKEHPHAFETVRQVLGHQTLESTTRSYVHLVDEAAVQLYDETILRVRANILKELG